MKQRNRTIVSMAILLVLLSGVLYFAGRAMVFEQIIHTQSYIIDVDIRRASQTPVNIEPLVGTRMFGAMTYEITNSVCLTTTGVVAHYTYNICLPSIFKAPFIDHYCWRREPLPFGTYSSFQIDGRKVYLFNNNTNDMDIAAHSRRITVDFTPIDEPECLTSTLHFAEMESTQLLQLLFLLLQQQLLQYYYHFHLYFLLLFL